MRLVLRNARARLDGAPELRDVAVERGRVVEVGEPGIRRGDREADLEGRVLMPALVNGHDHLDFSTFPPLGRPPYASVYAWAAAVNAGAGDDAARIGLAVPLQDRLFLGGLRNLLAGVGMVAHHNPFHRSLSRPAFPVKVLERYGFAHSPGLTPALRASYRSTAPERPWMVHAAEGTDDRCRDEIHVLAEAGVLAANSVLVHGVALSVADAPRLASAAASLIWCPESNRHLYAATAPAGLLQAAGLRLGLGSDSPASGVRDALSNLAAARHEAVFGDTELLALATRGTAEALRLPGGRLAAGAPADLLVLRDEEGALRGERGCVSLVIVAGRARYGERGLMAALAEPGVELSVDGAARSLERDLGRRAAALLRRHALEAVPWLTEVRFERC